MTEADRLRFAIDNGGTVTDLVAKDADAGEFLLERAPTAPHNTLTGEVVLTLSGGRGMACEREWKAPINTLPCPTRIF